MRTDRGGEGDGQHGENTDRGHPPHPIQGNLAWQGVNMRGRDERTKAAQTAGTLVARGAACGVANAAHRAAAVLESNSIHHHTQYIITFSIHHHPLFINISPFFEPLNSSSSSRFSFVVLIRTKRFQTVIPIHSNHHHPLSSHLLN